MTKESVLVFNITGEFGFFKTPEVTRGTLSFPFTRTSIIGMLGAILGEERNSYWKNDHPLGNASLALEIKNPVERSGLMFNYLHTKDIVTVGRGKSGKIKPLIPKGKDRGFVTAVRMDYLRRIHYRIYFHSPDTKLYKKLKKYLENRWCVFPPYLGQANLLANIEYLGEFSLKKKHEKKADISSVIPASVLATTFKQILSPTMTLVVNIPIRMIVEKNKVIGIETDDFILFGKETIQNTVKIEVSESEHIYSTKIKGQEKNIIFMPSHAKKRKSQEQDLSIINKERIE